MDPSILGAVMLGADCHGADLDVDDNRRLPQQAAFDLLARLQASGFAGSALMAPDGDGGDRALV